MMLTGTHLPRRTMLRGVGASLALPFLDAMVPASLIAAPPGVAPRRLAVVYVPNGMVMPNWTPAVEGAGFDLTPILAPLAPFRNQVTVVSGLDQKAGWARVGDGNGDHARASATFLTSVSIRKTEGADISSGISIDQIAAAHFGRETQLASLELTLESPEFLGTCDAGYSCVYTNTIAWRGATTPLPMENDPRAVFERLFGATDSTDPAARAARLEKDASILDAVTEGIRRLDRRLGARDQAKLAEYLDAVRDVERRIQKAREQDGRQVPAVPQPAGVPSSFEDYATLMFDLLALAYQCDLTRVATFMMGREVSGRPYPEIGVPDAHHSLSHHQNDPDKLARLTRINVHHMTLFTHFLEKLQATMEGDGSVLDHSMVVYGAGLSDSNKHMHDNLPLVVAGGAGRLTRNRHVRFAGDPPVANLYSTLLQRLGVPVDGVAGSDGTVRQLSGL